MGKYQGDEAVRYTKESFIADLIKWIKTECLDRHFGTFGFEITMHEGMPVSITKTERSNFNRIVGGIESK